MRLIRRTRLASVVGLCLVLAPLGSGCGNDKPETGTPAEPPKDLEKSNNAMEDFMKKGGNATP